MTFTVPHKSLQAACLIASHDAARPILEHVAVFADDLIVATDSYLLIMIGAQQETPRALVRRVRNLAADAAPTLVHRKHVHVLHTLAPKATTFDLDDDHGSVPGYRLAWAKQVGEYPRLDKIVSGNVPSPVTGVVSLNAAYTGRIGQAVNKLKPAGSWAYDTALAFHGSDGGDTTAKPMVWTAKASLGTVVAYQMPVRTSDAEWGVEPTPGNVDLVAGA